MTTAIWRPPPPRKGFDEVLAGQHSNANYSIPATDRSSMVFEAA